VEWSGVDWIGLQVAAILDILMMEFFGSNLFWVEFLEMGHPHQQLTTFCLVHWLNEFAQPFLVVSLANLLMWSSLVLQLNSSVSVLCTRESSCYKSCPRLPHSSSLHCHLLFLVPT
jgi:hypothetical protein